MLDIFRGKVRGRQMVLRGLARELILAEQRIVLAWHAVELADSA